MTLDKCVRKIMIETNDILNSDLSTMFPEKPNCRYNCLGTVNKDRDCLYFVSSEHMMESLGGNYLK